MKPSKVVYTCENCGQEFWREVDHVFIDDQEKVKVTVKLLNDAEGNVEEFPMCPCLGGDAEHAMTQDEPKGDE